MFFLYKKKVRKDNHFHFKIYFLKIWIKIYFVLEIYEFNMYKGKDFSMVFIF